MISHLGHVKGMMTSRPTVSKSIRETICPLKSFLLLLLHKAPPHPRLNKSGYGYNTPQGNISRIIYMDALKTNVKDDNQETGLL